MLNFAIKRVRQSGALCQIKIAKPLQCLYYDLFYKIRNITSDEELQSLTCKSISVSQLLTVISSRRVCSNLFALLQ